MLQAQHAAVVASESKLTAELAALRTQSMMQQEHTVSTAATVRQQLELQLQRESDRAMAEEGAATAARAAASAARSEADWLAALAHAESERLVSAARSEASSARAEAERLVSAARAEADGASSVCRSSGGGHRKEGSGTGLMYMYSWTRGRTVYDTGYWPVDRSLRQRNQWSMRHATGRWGHHPRAYSHRRMLMFIQHRAASRSPIRTTHNRFPIQYTALPLW